MYAKLTEVGMTFRVPMFAFSALGSLRLQDVRNRLLVFGGCALILALGVTLIPREERVLFLQPSGDPTDQETIDARHSAEQRLTSPTARTLHTITVFLLPPIPTGALEIYLQSRAGTRSATTPLPTTRSDGTLRVRFAPLAVQSGEALSARLTAKNVDRPIALRTATGVTEEMTGPVRIGNESRNRSVALALGAKRSLGAYLFSTARPSIEMIRAVDSATAGIALLGAAGGLLMFMILRRPMSSRRFWTILISAAALSLLLHEPFRLSYPATNDEGSILADARNLSPEFWPLQTGGAKGPLSLVALLPVVRTAEHPLLAARGIIALLTAVEVLLLGLLARKLWNERVGVVSAVLYAATPAAIAQTTQVFLQPFALPFVTLGWMFLIPPSAPRESKRHIAWTILGGACFALGFLARPTSLAFAPAAILVMLLVPRQPWSMRLRRLLFIGAGFLLTIALASALVLPTLGVSKTADLFGWQGFLVSQQRADKGLSTPGLGALIHLPRSLREVDRTLEQAWPLFVGALPLLLLSLGFLLRSIATLARFPLRATAIAFSIASAIAFVLVLRQPAITESFILHAAVVGGSMLAFLIALGSVIAQNNMESRTHVFRDLLLLLGTWALLVLGYANYGRFRSHYHAEFLPLYVFASAIMLSAVFSRLHTRDRLPTGIRASIGGGLLFALVGLSLAVTYPITRNRHHAGNIPLSIADAVAADLRERTKPGEDIFTAQVLFPILANRSIPYGIAHPGWYREDALGLLPNGLRAQYYPDRDTLRRMIETKPIRIMVIERRTREVFLEFDPHLRALVEHQYRLARTFDNPLVDSIEIWERTTVP